MFLSDGCSHSISFQNKKIVKTVPAFKPVSSREASGESDLSDTEDRPKHSSGKHNISKFYHILFNTTLQSANEFAKRSRRKTEVFTNAFSKKDLGQELFTALRRC